LAEECLGVAEGGIIAAIPGSGAGRAFRAFNEVWHAGSGSASGSENEHAWAASTLRRARFPRFRFISNTATRNTLFER
jgi:hypothetical protein